jgi:uncharacterized membrane protein
MHILQHKRDYYAGGLMVLLGLGMALKGPSYRLGTLMHMGPGFMPTALGVILIFLGILIALSAAATPAGEDERILPENPQWWGWFCILMGPVLFIVFGSYFGMAPAIFGCVFFSALGDREGTWRNSALLAVLVTGYGVALFSGVLQVPLQAFPALPDTSLPVVEIVWTFASAAWVSHRLFAPVPMPTYAAPVAALMVACAAVGVLYFLNFGGVVLFLSLWAAFGFALYGVFQKQSWPPSTSLIAALLLALLLACALVGLLYYFELIGRFVRKGGL